jgi:ribonuclease-3
MRSRFRTEPGPDREGEGRPDELIRVRGAQRFTGDEAYRLKARSRRRGGRGRRRRGNAPPPPPKKRGFLGWLQSLFAGGKAKPSPRGERREASTDRQEERVLAEFMKQFGITFREPGLLKLALTHRSYLSVTGQGPRESNERLEFLGDSVLGLVTSEYLYRRHPDEHEGQLTKTKSLLVSKAILSRRALRMGLGRYVLMSHSEVESGGRQRLSILADAFESVLGAIYLDQGFETARGFIHKHLLADSDEIVADKRHTNYKSHLQEYVQSTYRTHPVYRIRSEYGPDHSKHFMVEVMVGRRTLGEGRGHNKKEAEQAAARDALENVKRLRDHGDDDAPESREGGSGGERGAATGEGKRRRRRRGGRGRRDEVPRAGEGAPVQAGAEAGAVEEYEADEHDLADEAAFDVEVISPGGPEVAATEDDDDEDGIVDDLDETANDEIDDEADEDEDEDEDDEDESEDDEPRRGPSHSQGAHEERHVDPFSVAQEREAAAAAEAAKAQAEQARRASEMERAMENFGQRGPGSYGRRGRRR